MSQARVSAEARRVARRAAWESQGTVRAERAARERRLSGLGVEVMVALSERECLVAECERRAGEALLAMMAEGVALAEAIIWCGDALTRSEAARLRSLAVEQARVSSSPSIVAS